MRTSTVAAARRFAVGAQLERRVRPRPPQVGAATIVADWDDENQRRCARENFELWPCFHGEFDLAQVFINLVHARR